MSEIKLVLYKDNRTPRSIALSTRMIYRSLALAIFLGVLVVASLGLATRFYLLSRAKSSRIAAPISSASDEEFGPTNTPEQQIRSLHDQLDMANSRLHNLQLTLTAPKDIDKKNAALALFSPIVTDHTQNQNQVTIANFRYSKAQGKSPATLTFELHNANPGESVEKGYIVVLGRSETGLYAYPNVFNKTGPFLLDFEKGETFQVARFRLVNAQFAVDAPIFQILIFTRDGELLINQSYEVKGVGGGSS